MKQHPTIPAAPCNLQLAEGKCNLQLAAGEPFGEPLIFNFQFSIFNCY